MGNQMRMLAFLSAVVLLAPWHVLQCKAQSNVGENRPDALDSAMSNGSMLEAMAINAASVQTLDVLVRDEATHDISGDASRYDKVLTRLIIDFPAEKFLVVQFGESSTISEGEESRRAVRYGAMFDSPHLTQSQFNQIGKSKLTFKEALYELPGVVDIRYVGFRSFSAHFCRDLDFDNFLAATRLLDLKCKVQQSGPKSLEVSLHRNFYNSDEISINSWDFDQEKLVANSYYHAISRLENGERRLYPLARESIEWQEFDGTFVPISIKGVHHGSSQDADSDRVFSYEVDVDAQFHWFSVNEPIAEEKFSVEYLNDLSKAFSIVDPALSGATSLVD